uniref:PiggyBac transposable element-derived protein domain-containing protein n=1 Tax=Ditylenchus dipsaci TaxID=166011 RepID=A0A915ENP4_9BILA
MTNKEGSRVLANVWKSITIEEFRRFLGVLFLIGVYRGKNEPVPMLWNMNIGRECIRNGVARNRFYQILRFLRFDDAERRRRLPERRDKLAPIRKVFESFNVNLRRAYTSSECVTVDEQLTTFRARCSFREYIPSKPGKYGKKSWLLCDSDTSYVLNAQVYTGRDPQQSREVNQGQRVVLDLLNGLHFMEGRSVVTDNFFTSLSLARRLLSQKITLIGTVRHNRGEVPLSFIAKRVRESYSSVFGFQEKATLVSYCPKKGRNPVILLSTMHHNAKVSSSEQKKPEIVTDYNATKGGVDTLDQMVRTYSTKRKTCRWPMVIFYNMLDIAAVNAFVIWSKINPGIDESQKRGGSNGVFKKQKLRLWRKGIATGRNRRYKPNSPCNGRGFTVKGMFHVTAEHSHENKRNGGLGSKAIAERRQIAYQLSTTPIETLVKKVRHGASRLVRAHLPSKDSMARRLRQKKLKEVLRSIEHEEMIVPDSARETSDGERFLFWDSREQEPESTTILIWMSKVQETLLEETELLSFDATYKKSARGFYQFFCVYGRCDRKEWFHLFSMLSFLPVVDVLRGYLALLHRFRDLADRYEIAEEEIEKINAFIEYFLKTFLYRSNLIPGGSFREVRYSIKIWNPFDSLATNHLPITNNDAEDIKTVRPKNGCARRCDSSWKNQISGTCSLTGGL